MRDTTQLFQEPHSASQHQATIALNYIHELLCFILTYLCILIKMCPEVNCLYFMASLAYKNFILLSDSGKPVNLDDLVSVHFK